MVSFQNSIFFLCFNFLLLSGLVLSQEIKDSETQQIERVEDYYGDSSDDSEELMFMDATPGTTPDVCSNGTTCGFLAYDDATTGQHHHTYTHYCNCPEGLECLREGTNMELRYFYYKCQNSSEPAPTESYTTASTNTSELNTTEVPTEASTSDEPSSTTQSPTESQTLGKRFGNTKNEL